MPYIRFGHNTGNYTECLRLYQIAHPWKGTKLDAAANNEACYFRPLGGSILGLDRAYRRNSAITSTMSIIKRVLGSTTTA